MGFTIQQKEYEVSKMAVLMKVPLACADCDKHKCSTVCTYNQKACDGFCKHFEDHRNCNKKVCENFVKSKTPTWISEYLEYYEEIE